MQITTCLPSNSELIKRIDNLQAAIYNSVYWVTLPDVLSYTSYFSIHKVPIVRGISVINSGKNIEVEWGIDENRTISINSNISLLNSILTIY